MADLWPDVQQVAERFVQKWHDADQVESDALDYLIGRVVRRNDAEAVRDDIQKRLVAYLRMVTSRRSKRATQQVDDTVLDGLADNRGATVEEYLTTLSPLPPTERSLLLAVTHKREGERLDAVMPVGRIDRWKKIRVRRLKSWAVQNKLV